MSRPRSLHVSLMATAIPCILLVLVCVSLASAHYHATPSAKDFITGVEVSGGRVTRQSNRETIRIVPIFDISVDNALPNDKSAMLRTETVPKLIQFFEDSLSVDRIQVNLLFERACTGMAFFPSTSLEPRRCNSTCASSTTCGEVSIPEEHLKGCTQCNGMGSNNCEQVNNGGIGVSGADVVLYISAIDTNVLMLTMVELKL
ncbi:leishmanolysin-like peptidase [Halichondria panicea]|uniref:leishmanolysin-like peptidase n=1 Tax=Halichondria panicea TaxID=6063 RepID=UPI00312B7F8C